MNKSKYIIVLTSISLLSFCAKKNKRIVWEKTIGTICGKIGNNKKICYSVNNVAYSDVIGDVSGKYVIGAKYRLRYKSGHSNKIEFNDWDQFFEKDEATHYVIGTVTAIYKPIFLLSSVHALTYEYEVHGMKFVKFTGLSSNLEQIYPYLKENTRYYVQCWDEDLNRSIIRLDSPVN